jgi:hypothetical protein
MTGKSLQVHFGTLAECAHINASFENRQPVQRVLLEAMNIHGLDRASNRYRHATTSIH